MSVPSATILRPYSEPVAAPARVACHCLNVSSTTIESAIDTGAARTVTDVIRETGAGSGCTACHCTIRALLEAAGCRGVCASSHRFALSPEPAAVAG
jgi:bacterioferritin-associated ferredoxin